MNNANKIIGRIEECKRLDKCMRADSAQLVIVYGRRRVGKTYLINQYFDNNFAFKLTGIFDQNKETQLKNFITELDFRTKKNISSQRIGMKLLAY